MVVPGKEQLESTQTISESALRVTNLSADYFNFELGIWEPFLEQMSVLLRRKEDPESSKFDLKFLDNTDLNITESCLRNCILTY